MKRILFSLFILVNLNSVGQSIASDSKGKDVFNFYKAASLSVPVSFTTATAKINATNRIGDGKQYYIRRYEDKDGKVKDNPNPLSYNSTKSEYMPSDSIRFTMAKSFGVNYSFAAGNLLTNFAKVSTFHPTYTVGAGFGMNVDAFNNWRNIRNLKCFYTYNVNLYITRNYFNIYDTLSKRSDTLTPKSKGITAEWTEYFPSLFKSTKHQWLVALSASFNYEWGNNISALKDYQANKPIYSDPNAISLGDIVGKIGDLKDQKSFRGRISIPVFPTALMLFRNKKAETDGIKKYKGLLAILYNSILVIFRSNKYTFKPLDWCLPKC